MNQNKLSAAILIVSETAHKDPSTDKSGPTLRDVFEEDGSWNVKATKIVPDTVLDIQEHIEAFVDEDDAVNLIITSGGTGFATKDVTPEVSSTLPILKQESMSVSSQRYTNEENHADMLL